MHLRFLAPLALAIAAASCSSTDQAAVQWVDWGDDPMANPAFMEAMMAAGALGPQHEALAAHAGAWQVEGAYWMAPGGEATPMTATAQIASLFGGRFIVEAFSSEMMGQPYEGQLMQGYDNVTQRYWSVWTDSMNTGAWIYYGNEVEPGVIEYRGTGHDVFAPTGRPTRLTVTADGDEGYTMHMYDHRPGVDEYVVMELNYSRR